VQIHEPLPVESTAQRSLSAIWERVITEGSPALRDVSGVRPAVRASWGRALARGVQPSLPRAPHLLDDSALAVLRDDVDWLSHAERAVRAHATGSLLDGHILALFDARARMLGATGDPGALEGLADINFRPGALWSEEAVGTNGPGTALALGRAVHIVGAEHFCARWQGWHCAAAPVRDPLTQEIIGVLDLSGFRERAHPHTLSLATAIAAALEQRLAAREAERRVSLLRHYGNLVGRFPTDAILVVDRSGEIIASSSPAERLVRRLSASGAEATVALRDMSISDERERRGADWVPPIRALVRDAYHPLLGATAAVHAMHDGRTPIGACLVLPSGRRAPAPRETREAAVSLTAHRDDAHVTAPAPAVRATPRTASLRYDLDSLLGEAPVLDEVRRFARACARTDLPVLLLGESGTGKEVVAQGIHAASPRAGASFIAVNCAAVPRELIESELFGHVAGAFSGARREGAIGKFEAADGGTLFLDEIGELPPAAQAALLRVLQEGEITRLGATAGRTVDVRIIAATNRDVTAAIAGGQLRDDLYHRLNVLTLSLPPLRLRRGDPVLLARHFLARVPGTLAREFAPDVLHAFAVYRWPGNVRELENLVKRLAALAEGPLITADLLPAALRDGVRTPSPPTPSARGAAAFGDEGLDANEAVRAQLRARYAALIAAHPTVRDAAASLGITRSTLYRRLERLGLTPGRAVRDAGAVTGRAAPGVHAFEASPARGRHTDSAS
jgi:transcriptional regulator of acetoin/glycerol metabolism